MDNDFLGIQENLERYGLYSVIMNAISADAVKKMLSEKFLELQEFLKELNGKVPEEQREISDKVFALLSDEDAMGMFERCFQEHILMRYSMFVSKVEEEVGEVPELIEKLKQHFESGSKPEPNEAEEIAYDVLNFWRSFLEEAYRGYVPKGIPGGTLIPVDLIFDFENNGD